MPRPALAFIAFAAALAGAAPAFADEAIVVNSMPTGVKWMIGTQSVGPVPKGSFAIISMLEGRRSVLIEDGNGATAEGEINFDPAEFAFHQDRGFWCLLSRAAADGKPEIILLPKTICQQFLTNQPPPPRKP
jgi:hypothetical protein